MPQDSGIMTNRRWLILVVAAVALLAVVFLLQGRGPATPSPAGFQIPAAGERVTVNGFVGGPGWFWDGMPAFHLERVPEKDTVVIGINDETLISGGRYAPRRFIEGDLIEGDSVEVEAVSDGTRLIAKTVKRFRDTDQ